MTQRRSTIRAWLRRFPEALDVYLGRNPSQLAGATDYVLALGGHPTRAGRIPVLAISKGSVRLVLAQDFRCQREPVGELPERWRGATSAVLLGLVLLFAGCSAVREPVAGELGEIHRLLTADVETAREALRMPPELGPSRFDYEALVGRLEVQRAHLCAVIEYGQTKAGPWEATVYFLEGAGILDAEDFLGEPFEAHPGRCP